MSLRKSPQLTPALLAAARRNARHSTGPRSPSAKQNSKLNALKHGAYVSDDNQRPAMRALGEDPEQFQTLTEELRSAFGSGDALWEKQIDDLAWLYWRRDRLERAQAGLKRRALQSIDAWQHRRQQEMARVTFDASQFRAIDIEMTRPDDPGARLRLLLSLLGVIREQVKQRIFKPRQRYLLETLYRGQEGWRQARLCFLLYLFIEEVKRRAHPEDGYVYEDEFGRREQAGEAQYQELLRLLEEEIASVQEEFEYAEKANEERAVIERDACLAPEGETWSMLLRQEGALDRSIDRKVRILLRLRKDITDLPTAPAGQDDGGGMEDIAESPESDIVSNIIQGVEAVENLKMTERYANIIENKGPDFTSPRPSGNVAENKYSYAHNPGMLLKTMGVIVNTASVARTGLTGPQPPVPASALWLGLNAGKRLAIIGKAR
jgi:hypothetical protein